MSAVFSGHVHPSGSLLFPCSSSWGGMGGWEEDVILTSSWKQECVRAREQCHLPLLLWGTCPLSPGLPANIHKQVSTHTIWSPPPKSEPKKLPDYSNSPWLALAESLTSICHFPHPTQWLSTQYLQHKGWDRLRKAESWGLLLPAIEHHLLFKVAAS